MSTHSQHEPPAFDWSRQPQAALWVNERVEKFRQDCPAVDTLAHKMMDQTGTRLVDWIDHFALSASSVDPGTLVEIGYVAEGEHDESVWRHPQGLFPAIVLHGESSERIAIKVESVFEFLFTHRLDEQTPILGDPLSQLRRACFAKQADVEAWVVERHGYRGFTTREITPQQTLAVLRYRESLGRRKRDFDNDEEGFKHAADLIRGAQADLGVDWTCDLFFAAERDYWQSRNRAAQIQKARQDELGLGWANHDHHTYRSSREHFRQLIEVLELLGFRCRERFYAGIEAGWGAQVIEQVEAGITIFADVDLTADEVSEDFAHEPMQSQSRLGTVGLWCKLHGDAFLQAGMHHLEGQFDFAAACGQLRECGIDSMPPFTDFEYLKQCFTEGEIWPVRQTRLQAALDDGSITTEQADHFRADGAMGSHLEILERNDGYKGFNQSAISGIIRDTDPRKHSQRAR